MIKSKNNAHTFTAHVCKCPAYAQDTPAPRLNSLCVPFIELSLPMHACSVVWHEVSVWIRGAWAESNPGIYFVWPAWR